MHPVINADLPHDADFAHEHLCGLVDFPGRHETSRAIPTFSEAAPQLVRGEALDPPQDVLLYKAWKDVLGDYPHYVAQQIGDCTSFGSGHSLDLLQCIEIALGNQPIGYLETCTEAVYGMGREIAGMLGGGDGCYGGAVSRALVELGAVPRKVVGDYSGRRAKEWGARGVPQEIKHAAAEFKLGQRVLVTTLEEADAALNNLYPFLVCSNQGFTMTRDADGVCYPRGSWAHCMSCSGRRTRNGKRQYCIDQSWGDNVPSGPLSDDQPSFSFWIDDRVLASMLAGRDSFAFSKFAGFEKRIPPKKWTLEGFA